MGKIKNSIEDIKNIVSNTKKNLSPFLNFIVYTSEEKVYSKTRYLRP